MSLDSEHNKQNFPFHIFFYQDSIKIILPAAKCRTKGLTVIGTDWSFCPESTCGPVAPSLSSDFQQSQTSCGQFFQLPFLDRQSIISPSETRASDLTVVLLQASDGWYWKWLSKWRRKGEELGITEVGDLSVQELQVGSYQSNYC